MTYDKEYSSFKCEIIKTLLFSVKFIDYGANGTQILSSGEDSSLRAISTISETLNKSFGRASYNRKASKKRSKFPIHIEFIWIFLDTEFLKISSNKLINK